MTAFLNLATFKSDVKNLGPGNRFGIWVQGCPFSCHNCMSKDWIPFKEAQIVAVEDLARLILDTPNVDGITISGGEPMMQAFGLAKLIKLIQQEKPHLNVVCYTGFKLKQLTWVEAQDLLKVVDVLITGLYVDKLNDNKGLRGSSNQQVHFLTDTLLEYEYLFNDSQRVIEISISNESGIFITGMPARRITEEDK